MKDLVKKNVLSCLLKDGKKVNAVMPVRRLFHARVTVTRNDRSPMVLSAACEHQLILTAGVDVPSVGQGRLSDARTYNVTVAPCTAAAPRCLL